MAETNSPAEHSRLVRILERIAFIGNKLPDPVTLFAILAGIVVIASVLFDGVSVEMTRADGTASTKTVGTLLSAASIKWMFTSAVTNFTGFAPLGKVLTVMIGVGVAERSGLITMALRTLVSSVPSSAITAALVFAGVMSSMAADSGYVVLTPLGAVLFAGLGRHPLAGLAAAFAGVSAGFSANLLVTGLDPLLAGLTHEAARIKDPSYSVNATCNYYFMFVSVFVITAVGTLVTTRIVEPMLGKWDPQYAQDPQVKPHEASAEEKRAFKMAVGASLFVAAILAVLAMHPDSPLRVPVKPGRPAVDALAPFFKSIEILIALLFFVPGVVYGALTGTIKNDKDVAKMTSDTMATMGAYIVLAFVAAQFVAWFNHCQLGAVTAVKGAEGLQAMGIGGIPLLLAFLVVASMMNMFVGSASAKWTFMAPIFVPMMMEMGFSPEAVQAAYRVGDSITNIITPLMPYLPIIIVFAQKYDKRAGLGTLMSAMLPFSIAFGIVWTIMLAAWIGFDLPLGPGVSATYP